MLKGWKTAYRRLKKISPNESEDEIIAQAKFMVATPDQRWQANVAFWKSRNLWTIEQRRKAGWGETYEEQKDSPKRIPMQKQFVKFLAAEHGFEP